MIIQKTTFVVNKFIDEYYYLNDIELIGFVAKAEGTEDVSDYYAVGIIQDSNNKDVLIPIHIDSNDAIFDEINDYYKEINENDDTASLIKDCCGQAKEMSYYSDGTLSDHYNSFKSKFLNPALYSYESVDFCIDYNGETPEECMDAQKSDKTASTIIGVVFLVLAAVLFVIYRKKKKA